MGESPGKKTNWLDDIILAVFDDKELAKKIIDLKNKIFGRTKEELKNLKDEVGEGADKVLKSAKELLGVKSTDKISFIADSTGGAIGTFLTDVKTYVGQNAKVLHKRLKGETFVNRNRGQTFEGDDMESFKENNKEVVGIFVGINDCVDYLVRVVGKENAKSGNYELTSADKVKLKKFMGRSIEEMAQMVDYLKDNNVKPLLCTVFLPHSPTYGDLLNDTLKIFNELVRDLAVKKECALVDFEKGISLDEEDLSKDGLHMKPSGVTKFRSYLESEVLTA